MLSFFVLNTVPSSSVPGSTTVPDDVTSTIAVAARIEQFPHTVLVEFVHQPAGFPPRFDRPHGKWLSLRRFNLLYHGN